MSTEFQDTGPRTEGFKSQYGLCSPTTKGPDLTVVCRCYSQCAISVSAALTQDLQVTGETAAQFLFFLKKKEIFLEAINLF